MNVFLVYFQLVTLKIENQVESINYIESHRFNKMLNKIINSYI